MPGFAAKERKTAADGRPVTLYRDSSGAWYVGAPGELECDPMPMGAFTDLGAARRWADRRFPGGAWARAGAPKRLPAGVHLRPVTET